MQGETCKRAANIAHCSSVVRCLASARRTVIWHSNSCLAYSNMLPPYIVRSSEELSPEDCCQYTSGLNWEVKLQLIFQLQKLLFPVKIVISTFHHFSVTYMFVFSVSVASTHLI